MARSESAVGTPATAETLRLTRRFDAPREAVFRAFTDPVELAAWFGPEKVSVRKVEIDLKPGGRYSLEMHETDGGVYPLSGVYREVSPPERLVFTWIWGTGGMAGVETVVTIELLERNGGTELLLVHEGLPTRESHGLHEQGWSSSLGCLHRHLGQESRS